MDTDDDATVNFDKFAKFARRWSICDVGLSIARYSM